MEHTVLELTQYRIKHCSQKRELLEEYPFDLKYKIAADQDWIMKMHKSGKKFHYIDMPISNYDMYGISASEVGREKGKNRVIRNS